MKIFKPGQKVVFYRKHNWNDDWERWAKEAKIKNGVLTVESFEPDDDGGGYRFVGRPYIFPAQCFKLRKPNTMTQKDRIRNHFSKGKSLTPVQAFDKFDCLRLAAVVNKLNNEGMNIKNTPVSNNGKRFASYKLN